MIAIHETADDMLAFIRTLDRGDTFEARVTYPGGSEGRRLYEIASEHRPLGDRNGLVTIKRLNLNAANNTRRLYVTDDGISVGHNWSPGETMLDAVAAERGTLTVATYHLEADRDDEGKITATRLVRDGETTDPDHIEKQIAAAEKAHAEAEAGR